MKEIDMKGAINYLISLRDTCKEYKGDCKRCPLGKEKSLQKTLCPRLTHPESWSDDKIVDMVRDRR
jgi:hypothetical protein